MTTKEMLDNLESIGIGLAPGFTLADIEKEFSPEDGYDLLLCELGGVTYDAEERPKSHNIWYGDIECVYGDGSYVEVAKRLILLAGDDLPLTNLRDHIEDGDAWFEFTLNGKTQRWNITMNEDWLDVRFIEKFAQLLASRSSGRRFILCDLGGQDFLMACATPTQTERLCQLTGLRFESMTK